MALCEECKPSCDHDYCDNCSKCHICGSFSSAPASPATVPRVSPLKIPWPKPRTLFPSEFEVTYDQFAIEKNSYQQVQIH